MRQHYIPKFYLTNFASKEGKRSKLWVLDKDQRRQWTTTPTKAAHRRNYYRISEQTADDPNVIEHAMGNIESQVAPVLRKIVASNDLPASREAHDIFINFVALMVVRVPGTRNATNGLVERFSKQIMQGVVSSPEKYETLLKEMQDDGVEIDDEVGYEAMQNFLHRDEYSIEISQDFTLEMMLESFDTVLWLLAKRNWFLLIADDSAPDYVCSDRPVSLDWFGKLPSNPSRQPGFATPGSIVRFPLSPRVALAGLFTKVEPTCDASPEHVARTNTCTCGLAERFIYSATQDFVWMHRDWSLKNVRQFMDKLATLKTNGGKK